jgi:hypothetical protein
VLYEQDDVLPTVIQARDDVDRVSSRDMRIPLQVSPGGKADSYCPIVATRAKIGIATSSPSTCCPTPSPHSTASRTSP